jgi:low temperature requirement protein LtrA
MSEAALAESGGSGEHAVTPLELLFDLVFVFAITQ